MPIADLVIRFESAASICVVLAIVCLTIQMVAATKKSQRNIEQALYDELQEVFHQLNSDPGLSKVFRKASKNEPLDELGRIRYNAFIGDVLNICEDAFRQTRESAIGEAHWTCITSMMIDLRKMSAFDAYWHDRKHLVSTEFRNFVNYRILHSDAKAGSDAPSMHKWIFVS
ncbi:MAG: hypothetical protein AB8B86_20065 [Pseudomonadales bacterium]